MCAKAAHFSPRIAYTVRNLCIYSAQTGRRHGYMLRCVAQKWHALSRRISWHRGEKSCQYQGVISLLTRRQVLFTRPCWRHVTSFCTCYKLYGKCLQYAFRTWNIIPPSSYAHWWHHCVTLIDWSLSVRVYRCSNLLCDVGEMGSVITEINVCQNDNWPPIEVAN